MFKLDLEKAEEPEIELPTSTGLLKKQESSRKTSISALLTMPKPLTVWITINCVKFFFTCLHFTCLLRSFYAGQEATVRTGNGATDWFTVYCHPACLTYCRVHYVKCWVGWSTSWNKDCQEKYQQPQIGRWHHPNGRMWRRTKEPLDKSERGEWKSWLKTQHSEN